MRLIFCLSLLLIYVTVTAQEINIIPQPSSIKKPANPGNFVIDANTVLVAEGSKMENSIQFFNSYLQRYYGIQLANLKTTNSKNSIRFNYDRLDKTNRGAYTMTIDNKGVYIGGDNEEGVFYGVQTLIQLLPLPDPSKKTIKKIAIPFVAIEDEPRFGYRGLHLDVARHFMPVDFVKKYIDYIALHKMNYFHWHLTDDQGWRIEIKKYPKLTSIAAWRNGTIIGRYPGTGNDGTRYGGFYSQEEIKDVVAYAEKRYITIIPEIEMPGHSSAAIAAYPELSCFPDKTTEYPVMCAWSGLREGKQVQQTWGVFNDVYCAGKENTFRFLQDVMDEVLILFPSPYIHAGGDECPKENWKKCPACQQRMKENNLKDEHQLQSYFIQRMEKYLNSKGRTLIGWDEILEGGLAQNAVVMSWRGEKGGIEAAHQKHKVIMSPQNPVYFDHTQSENEDSVTIGGFNPIEKVYSYDPLPKELDQADASFILGAQANLWSEYMSSPRKVEYMLLPRLSALSEVLWSQKEKKDCKNFEQRLPVQMKRYELWKATYSKAYFELKTSVLPTTDSKGVRWVIVNKFTPPTNSTFYKEGKMKLPQKTGDVMIKSTADNPADLVINSSGLYSVTTFQKAGSKKIKTGSNVSMSKRQFFSFNKATGKKITLTTEASPNYPGEGSFTLVNGIVNEKGFNRSREFLGFNGTDCEAIIDLGEIMEIDSIVVHFLDRKSSWIWRPETTEASASLDGKNWTSLKLTDDVEKHAGENARMMLNFNLTRTKYLKIKIMNWGNVPEGSPGAGNKAWLFVDEIELY